MDAEFSVELGPASEEATLEFPWIGDSESSTQYYDLKRHPELLPLVEEAARYAEMGEFLACMNSDKSVLETAKCDVWFSDQLSEEEAIYGAACKQCSYVDLIFAEPEAEHRLSFFRHEELTAALVKLLRRAPEISAAAEFIVRRCYYRSAESEDGMQEGFYITFYLSGYGDERDEARQRWQIGLKLVGNAMLQLSAASRH